VPEPFGAPFHRVKLSFYVIFVCFFMLISISSALFHNKDTYDFLDQFMCHFNIHYFLFLEGGGG
jgi:hypothetical protein